MTTNAPPTIISLKSTFLTSQIRSLSQPLQATASFLSTNAEHENRLRQKNIDSVLQQLNERLKKHNKLRYGPQAQRHVAEQVDRLYWGAGERGVVTLELGEEWVDKGTDYRQETTIIDLPSSWPGEAASQYPDEAEKFAELQNRLVLLNEKRNAARKRLEDHRRVRELVAAFGEDAGVQDNLVGRNGEVEVELEKMRRLMARVERGMMGLERPEGEEESMEVDEWEGEEERKMLGILG